MKRGIAFCVLRYPDFKVIPVGSGGHILLTFVSNVNQSLAQASALVNLQQSCAFPSFGPDQRRPVSLSRVS